ncbi:hypothetical protein QR680_000496 [Steinernema hermaphroditum]|uniref:Uncharacterized protein n=1 Tax=Steinernema hermaphroditum TaxID=289476 RepID=A0AA39GUT9_9BILA|nr:hypothetical protein QR680_000496 [Steinernema hermaphroditum]
MFRKFSNFALTFILCFLLASAAHAAPSGNESDVAWKQNVLSNLHKACKANISSDKYKHCVEDVRDVFMFPSRELETLFYRCCLLTICTHYESSQDCFQGKYAEVEELVSHFL